MTATATLAWDEISALNAVEGDRELLVEMAELFLADSTGLTEEIGRAVAEGDTHALLVAAHTLKGSVGNFAAHAAREAAYQLEMMGRLGRLEGAEQTFAVLLAEIHHVEADLAAFMRG